MTLINHQAFDDSPHVQEAVSQLGPRDDDDDAETYVQETPALVGR